MGEARMETWKRRGFVRDRSRMLCMLDARLQRSAYMLRLYSYCADTCEGLASLLLLTFWCCVVLTGSNLQLGE